MSFWCLQFSQKNELENVIFCPSLLGQKFFVHFLEELKKPKFPFEINWPLVSKAACNLVYFHTHTFYSIGRSRLKIEIAFGWNYSQGCWNVGELGELSPPSFNGILIFSLSIQFKNSIFREVNGFIWPKDFHKFY